MKALAEAKAVASPGKEYGFNDALYSPEANKLFNPINKYENAKVALEAYVQKMTDGLKDTNGYKKYVKGHNINDNFSMNKINRLRMKKVCC